MEKLFVLMFHGLGATKNTMGPIGDYCEQRIDNAQFLSVQAPMNLGNEQNPVLGWFVPPDDRDRALEGTKRPKLNGLAESVAYIHGMLRELTDKGVYGENIHLLGHSQGGAVALASGLTYAKRLGSVCTIAGYLALTSEMYPIASETRYVLHHSEQDDNVGVQWAHYAHDFIQNIGESCQLKCWNIHSDPHSIHSCQLDSICSSISGE